MASRDAGYTQPFRRAHVDLRIGDRPGSGAQALLTAAGLISKLPFRAQWADFLSSATLLSDEAAGSLDVGLVEAAAPVFAAAGGRQVAIVGALRAGPAASALLVSAHSRVHSLAQLSGRRIAVTPGTAAGYHLLSSLASAGLTARDVTIDSLQPAAALAAFAAGRVAAWAAAPPFAEQAEYAYHARILRGGHSSRPTYLFVIASAAALRDAAKVAAIDDYVRLVDEAYAWAGRHPAAWAATWATATGLPLPVMTQAARDDRMTPVGISPAVAASGQRQADAAGVADLVHAKARFALLPEKAGS